MDRPTVQELLGAVRSFLEKELMPELEGVRRFHARVAVNVLGIVSRELALEGVQRPAQHARLLALLARTEACPTEPRALDRAVEALERELCARIRAGFGEQAAERARLLEHLRATAAERLAVSNPTYA
ncbi:MAG: DUF6285 domain-containing protein [bacterium]